MNTEVMFSKDSDEWGTPEKYFKELDEGFGGFNFDLAASSSNYKVASYYSKEDDALIQDWAALTHKHVEKGESGWLWCNPPYSKCKEFVAKAHAEMHRGANIVMLLPARTDTKWFHDYIYQDDFHINVQFIKGRLKFGDSKNSAPFPSMLVIFTGQ